MKKRKCIIISTIVFFSTSSLLFASGVGLTDIGARATALGGNFRGIADDWSAMYWNPAGITQIDDMQFGSGLEILWPVAEYLPAPYSHPIYGDGHNFSGFYNKTIRSTHQTFLLPSAGFVYSMKRLSLGLGLFIPFGLSNKWDVMNTSTYNSEYPEFEYNNDLKILDIHPTISFKVNDRLSIGAGFGFLLSKIKIVRPIFAQNPVVGLLKVADVIESLDPDNPLSVSTANYIRTQVLDSLGAKIASPYDHLLMQFTFEADGIGFGFNFGIKYNITQNFSIGVSGRYYSNIEYKGTLKKDIYFATHNSRDSLNVNLAVDTAKVLLLAAAQGSDSLWNIYVGEEQEYAMRNMYSGIVSKFTNNKTKANMPLPMEIGLGFSYKGISNLLISGDISWTQWSVWDVIEIEQNEAEIKKLIENWEDGIRVGLGLEYTVNNFKLRAGYYTEPSSIPDETLTITIPDINRRHAIMAGLSYCFGPFDLFASYEKILLGDRTVDNWKLSDDSTDYDNMAGKYKMNVNNIMLGIGYNF